MSECDNCIMNFREDCSGIDCVQIRIAMNDHDKQIRDEVIDEFAHELKETFNQETPSNMSCYEKYFALDDCRMWVDIIANMMKGEQNDGQE